MWRCVRRLAVRYKWGILLLLFLIVVLSLVIFGKNRYENGFFQSFFSNALATLIGVVIGVPFALWIGSIQEGAKERERKGKILDALGKELGYNHNKFSDWQVRDKTKPSGHFSLSLRDEIWRAFADGGELEWINDLELLTCFAEAYASIRRVCRVEDRLYMFYSAGWNETSPDMIDALDLARDIYIDESKKTIEESIVLMKKHFQEYK